MPMGVLIKNMTILSEIDETVVHNRLNNTVKMSESYPLLKK